MAKQIVTNSPLPPGIPAPHLAAPVAPPRQGAAPNPVPRRKSALYAMAWVAAGLLSAGYVATAFRQPGVVGDLVMRPDAPTTNVSKLAQVVSKTEADVSALKQAVTSLQGGLLDAQSRADQIDARERQLVERVGAVETRVEQFAVASVGVQAVEPARPVRTAQAPAPVKQPVRTAVQPPAAKQKAVETASIPAPAQRELAEQRQAPASPAAALADSRHGVQVASGPSIDALRLSWSLLSDRDRATFGKLEPRVVTTDGNTYQLIAGPFPSTVDASKACLSLKARGIACRPTEFRGDAL